jgi:hypothetical protein
LVATRTLGYKHLNLPVSNKTPLLPLALPYKSATQQLLQRIFYAGYQKKIVDKFWSCKEKTPREKQGAQIIIQAF